MNGTNTFKQDFFCGFSTSAITATLTNGFYHRQYCQVKNYPFYFKDCWRGFIPNFGGFLGCLLLGNVAKGGMTRYLVKKNYPITDTTKIVIGTLSGGISAFGVVTGEYLALKDNGNGKGFFRNAAITFKKEGPRALWKGTTPTFFRDLFAIGVALGGGEVVKKRIKRKYQVSDSAATGMASISLGLIASVATQPLQVVRIEFQSRKDTTLKHVAQKIFKKEGMKGFFKASSSRIFVTMVIIASDIVVNEKIQQLARKTL